MDFVSGQRGKKNDGRIWNDLCSAWRNNRTANYNSSENVKRGKNETD